MQLAGGVVDHGDQDDRLGRARFEPGVNRGVHEDELAAGGAALTPAAMAVPAAAGRPEAGLDEPASHRLRMHDPNDGIAGEMLTQERGAEVRIERVLDFGEHVRAERIRLGIGRSLPAGVLDHGEIAFGFEAAPQATEVAARDMAAARAIADAEHVVVHLMQEDQAVALLLAHRQHVRHGTTDLFAALDLTAGTVIGETHRRHRRVEFRQFLDTIDRRTPRALDVHLILDNSSIHKTPLIHRWLAKRPRFHVHFVHFTSTSASWLNLVESWFAILTKRQRTRGVHRSTAALERAIRDYIAHADREAKPFVWTKTADEIFESVARSCQRTNSDH